MVENMIGQDYLKINQYLNSNEGNNFNKFVQGNKLDL